jgi:thiosulfate reductase / polysulfide reductase chain A
LTRVIEPTGMSWEAFKAYGIAGSSTRYYKYTKVNPETGQPQGFATPSGKVELANEMFEEMGAGLVANWFEIPGIHNEVPDDPNYVTLITGARKQPYWASCYFEVESFRKAHPKPLVDMSENTANRLGLEEGDECLISRIDDPSIEVLQYVHIADIVDDIASAEYGWWYPEICKSSDDFEECFKSNINYLTRGYVDTDPEPLIGTWIYNGIPCRIRKKE